MIESLVAVFVVSGAAGLIYESIWTRYLGLFVGHSAYAQIIVLVIFLGGMSLGAHLTGRWSQRLRAPLLWYAGVELVIGVLAILFHDAFVAVTGAAYDSIFPSLGGPTLIAVKWLIASLLILPQSVLLGATFPLMSAGAIRLAGAAESPGRLLSLLYFSNSIGAAFGVLLAGFVLIGAVGLPGTLLTAAMMNIAAAAVVAVVGRIDGKGGVSRLDVGDVADRPIGGDGRVLLWVSFGTAVASFVYEIAWIRMLSLVLGSATHSFELMLSAFILGLALGALWIRSRADTLPDPVRFLGVMQWIMGVLAVATMPLYVASFDWISSVLHTVQQNESGYRAFSLARYAIALIIMLPATFCAGTTLPLITRVLMREGTGERAIGVVYAVNTLGSIAGVILASLILMPVLGLKKLLVFGAIIDTGLGVWLVWRGLSRSVQRSASRKFDVGSPLTVPVIATAVLMTVIAVGARFDLARLTSGVYRHGVVSRPGDYTFPYYRDGRTATVSVRKGADGFITLATNGKPDASMEREWLDTVHVSENRQLTRDIATQLLLPIITLAHAPNAANVAVIGFGSGMTTHVLLGSPLVKEVVTIEIEPEMIAGARSFRPANHRAYDDRRSTFVIDDAKSYFASAGRKFDLILSEPSNPWVSGVSGLFTHEFYRRVRQQLSPTGVFGQWLHLYELNDGLVTSVLAAIDSVFPAYEVFFTSNTDILVVAANHPLPAPDWNITRYPGIAADMRHTVPFDAASFESLRLGGRAVLHPMILAHGAPNSDFFPVLDLGAERMRFMKETAEGYTNLSSGRFDVVAALSGRRADFGMLASALTPEIPRSEALAAGARLRAIRSLPAADAARVPRDEAVNASLYRLDELERVDHTGRAPLDWHQWMEEVVQCDADIHSGTAGVADESFFADVRGFASRAGAPADARAALDFLHGLSTWNWREAAGAAQTLMTSPDPAPWLPDPMVRNGATVSYIMLRDTAGAKNTLRYFAKRTNEDQLRERLIASYLIYQDSTLRRRMGWR